MTDKQRKITTCKYVRDFMQRHSCGYPHKNITITSWRDCEKCGFYMEDQSRELTEE